MDIQYNSYCEYEEEWCVWSCDNKKYFDTHHFDVVLWKGDTINGYGSVWIGHG